MWSIAGTAAVVCVCVCVCVYRQTSQEGRTEQLACTSQSLRIRERRLTHGCWTRRNGNKPKDIIRKKSASAEGNRCQIGQSRSRNVAPRGPSEATSRHFPAIVGAKFRTGQSCRMCRKVVSCPFLWTEAAKWFDGPFAADSFLVAANGIFIFIFSKHSKICAHFQNWFLQGHEKQVTQIF